MPFFPNCHNLIAHGTFIDGPVSVHNDVHYIKGTGFDALRKASIPQAIHDSSARDPPRCFPGTREEHIRNITSWGAGDWGTRQARMLWLHGPAGVGKSALAQTCAERLGDRLGASFFFSRPSGWIKSAMFLPTIVYQLATKSVAYRDVVDSVIVHDPFVLEKSIDVQFRELLAKPLRQLSGQDQGIKESVIIIDGLDECDDQDAQCAIIEIVTTSILQESTPFLWALFSRPEPHIVSAFSAEQTNNICWQLTLPVSGDADQDIEAYLRDGFRMIRAKYNWPPTITWPSEEIIRQLVRQSAGLFAYPASVIRHIAKSPGTLGPERQLQSVLEMGENHNNGCPSDNPLANLDQFYILIMKQIPKEILPNTLLLLFPRLHYRIWTAAYLPIFCRIFGFSPITVYAALNNLHSVLKVEESSDGVPICISFYHTSFADFLRDVTRSTPEFCINTPDIYNRFYSLCVGMLCRPEGGCSINMLAQWPNSTKVEDRSYPEALRHLLMLVENVDLGAGMLRRISRINWAFVANVCGKWSYDADDIKGFMQKIPESWYPKIIRVFDHSLCPSLHMIQPEQRSVLEDPERRHYVVGNGSNVALFMQGEAKGAFYWIEPYPS